jgi:hypothetical protein
MVQPGNTIILLEMGELGKQPLLIKCVVTVSAAKLP